MSQQVKHANARDLLRNKRQKMYEELVKLGKI